MDCSSPTGFLDLRRKVFELEILSSKFFEAVYESPPYSTHILAGTIRCGKLEHDRQVHDESLHRLYNLRRYSQMIGLYSKAEHLCEVKKKELDLMGRLR